MIKAQAYVFIDAENPGRSSRLRIYQTDTLSFAAGSVVSQCGRRARAKESGNQGETLQP